MKKLPAILFLAVCMLICAVPAVCTVFMPTTETTENKTMAAAPEFLTDEGRLNTEVFSEFDDWFEEHIAFRNYFVSADARIQSTVFGVSSVSGVILGTDDWLYYSSTLSDYLGEDVFSGRELYNTAHNLAVVQQYLEERGVAFAAAIPANKNTLYGENMPYYDSCKISDAHSAELLVPYLKKLGVNYADLISLFREQDEVLYLLRDSHWNNKGALLAYNAMLDAAGIAHDDGSNLTYSVESSCSGDLNKMLYSYWGTSERNYSYNMQQLWSFTDESATVESGWSSTENPYGSGTLLMFRDSFGNTLIPFLSNTFGTAYYSKSQPALLELYLNQTEPDCVLFEKVERNLVMLLNAPPICTAPETNVPETCVIADGHATASVAGCAYDLSFYAFSGVLDSCVYSEDTEIIVEVDGTCFRAYQTGENGYLLYIPKDFLTAGGKVKVRVFAETGDVTQLVGTAKLTLPD